MSWTNYFDKIYLVNLPDQTERLASASQELNKYNIPFTVWPAYKSLNGANGLLNTMASLFAANRKAKRILVFEDDVKFVEDPNIYMPKCVEQLKSLKYWDLFYLGINMDNENNLFSHWEDENLLPVKFGYATHALAYSNYAINELYKQYIGFQYYHCPVDKIIAETLLKKGDSYCSYPLLATQADGWSSIENKNSTYEYIQQRFDHSIKHLLDKKQEL